MNAVDRATDAGRLFLIIAIALHVALTCLVDPYIIFLSLSHDYYLGHAARGEAIGRDSRRTRAFASGRVLGSPRAGNPTLQLRSRNPTRS